MDDGRLGDGNIAPSTMPGTAATVSSTTALLPYCLAKKASAKTRKP
jgi:hypothetical protein